MWQRAYGTVRREPHGGHTEPQNSRNQLSRPSALSLLLPSSSSFTSTERSRRINIAGVHRFPFF
ncbi:uncharacterized protein BDV17DRAFT_260468 [Aspergillus undulatus]|uniref:uncharacterized protein n=1 Tax=Aspergillus undulatus TaxID=1810928 RepID=UPI003CCD3E8D